MHVRVEVIADGKPIMALGVRKKDMEAMLKIIELFDFRIKELDFMQVNAKGKNISKLVGKR